MANNAPITLNENNDEDLDVTITTNIPTPGTPLDVTGMSIEVYLKATATMSDTDPAVWKGVNPTNITLTDPTNGVITVAIPASAVTTGVGWWRVDVISAGKRKTAGYGHVTVVDM